MASHATRRIVPPAWPGREQRVAHGIPCRACGHDVHGLGASERCPFCGAAAGFTLEGELIRFSDPRWVRTLRGGIAMIFVGLFVFICGWVVAMLMTLKDPHALNRVLWLLLISVMTAATSSVAGMWLLTRRDPTGAGEGVYGRSRRLVRLMLILTCPVLPATAVAVTLLAGRSIPLLTTIVVEALRIAAVVATCFGTFAQLDYLRKLSRKRLRDPVLSPRFDFLFRAAGISQAIAMASLLVYRYAVLAHAPLDLIALLVLLTCTTALPALVFSVMYLFALDRLRRALGEAADWAEQTWAGSSKDDAGEDGFMEPAVG